MFLQPGNLFVQHPVFVDLDLFGLIRVGRSIAVRAGTAARDQLVETQDRRAGLVRDRIDGVTIEVERNDINLRDGHIAGDVVIDLLNRLVVVVAQILGVTVDCPDARQQADGSDVLINLLERIVELQGGVDGIGVGGALVIVQRFRLVTLGLDENPGTQKHADCHDNDGR